MNYRSVNACFLRYFVFSCAYNQHGGMEKRLYRSIGRYSSFSKSDRTIWKSSCTKICVFVYYFEKVYHIWKMEKMKTRFNSIFYKLYNSSSILLRVAILILERQKENRCVSNLRKINLKKIVNFSQNRINVIFFLEHIQHRTKKGMINFFPFILKLTRFNR